MRSVLRQQKGTSNVRPSCARSAQQEDALDVRVVAGSGGGGGGHDGTDRTVSLELEADAAD